MTCRAFRGAGTHAVSGFVCGRSEPACSVDGCGARAERLCDYPLRGPKAGQTCSRKLCAKHSDPEGGKDYCPAHARELAGR